MAPASMFPGSVTEERIYVTHTSPHVAGVLRDPRKPLNYAVPIRSSIDRFSMDNEPEVLEIRNLALVRFARPNMLSVPRNEVLMVFTALN
jgi:hypothetical protein